MASEGINLSEALEWYDFFSKNDLDVFDVLHGALSVAVLYWPDDFIKKRDDIAQFLNAKKPFDWFRRHKNKDKPTSSGSDSDDVTKSSDDAIIMSSPSPPASIPLQEPPSTTLHWKEEVAANTEETKAKSPISSLPTISDIRKPEKCPASLPYEEALTTKKKMSTKKIGLRRRLIKEEKQNHELMEDSSKDHHHVQVSGTILGLSANKGTPGGYASSTTPAADKEAKTLVLSSSIAAKGTSGIKKINSAATAKMMKLQTTDEAALERKLEASKRKLHDGYKNAEAAKKRIRLIDATDVPKRQRNIVPAVNCTSRIRVN